MSVETSSIMGQGIDKRMGVSHDERLEHPGAGHPGGRGILPQRSVRIGAFSIISLTLFACAVLCLLAVWDFATGDTAWRAFSSLGIITATMIAFVFVNEVFGSAVRGE